MKKDKENKDSKINVEEQNLHDGDDVVADETSQAVDDSPEAMVQRYVDDEERGDERLGCMSFYRAFVTGDVFTKPFFQRQVLFIIFVALLMLLYTGNRYASQQDLITIDSLKKQLQQERYFVLTQSSELLNLTRQSNIEQRLQQNGDSALVNPAMPPFEIVVDEETDPIRNK